MTESRNIRGERSFIASIINRGLVDAISYKNPRSPSDRAHIPKKRINPDEPISWEARQFLTSNSEIFCIYANLLDIDPDYLSEKIAKQIKLFDTGKENIFRKQRNSIDFSKVNTL